MDPVPPWARLPDEGPEGAPEDNSTTPPAEGVRESALRWRLVLGRFAEEPLKEAAASDPTPPTDDFVDRAEESSRIDRSLQFVYDREFAKRAHRRVGPGEGRGLTVPAWLAGVRELFPADAVEVIERDALVRYGMTELVRDPDVLRRAEPTQELVKAILQFKHLMPPEVLSVARELVQTVVEELRGKLETRTAPALRGPADASLRPPRRTWRNTDWHRTIRRNLRHWDPDRQQLIPAHIHFRHRQHERAPWRIIVAVDQSGSMLDSLIHSAVMAAIFAGLPAVTTHLVLWDHRIFDVSDLAHDPLEVLMACQLGGGTRMLQALQYCAGLVTEPHRTILVLLSDFYVWDEASACIELARELAAAGVQGIGLPALDERGRGVYDERFARELADAGWSVGAMSPQRLAEHVARWLG